MTRHRADVPDVARLAMLLAALWLLGFLLML